MTRRPIMLYLREYLIFILVCWLNLWNNFCTVYFILWWHLPTSWYLTIGNILVISFSWCLFFLVFIAISSAFFSICSISIYLRLYFHISCQLIFDRIFSLRCFGCLLPFFILCSHGGLMNCTVLCFSLDSWMNGSCFMIFGQVIFAIFWHQQRQQLLQLFFANLLILIFTKNICPDYLWFWDWFYFSKNRHTEKIKTL
jgi:hypothetical protein